MPTSPVDGGSEVAPYETGARKGRECGSLIYADSAKAEVPGFTETFFKHRNLSKTAAL